MRVFGLDISRAKSMTPVPSRGGWFNIVREPFTGAWQRNAEQVSSDTILRFSAVYACVTLISDDIAKLRPKITKRKFKNLYDEVADSRGAVLRKPNSYQNRIQFVSAWVVCKMLHGNTFVLKERNDRRQVIAMHVLEPSRVRPMVTGDGGVYYSIDSDSLSGVVELDGRTVPASEIIHDRGTCLFHPLVGVSPIFACSQSAAMGIRIQGMSEKFFANMSRPSGMLTAPGEIATDTAARLKDYWDEHFTGSDIGKIAVLGDGLKYEAMTIPASDAQLIEQLKWSIEDVARCFHVPLHKISAGSGPGFTNIGALNQDYYTQTLQILIESIELLLDTGLDLPEDMQTEFETEGLLRMDPLSRADVALKGITAGYIAPNEAREIENKLPVPGGDTPYMQQQNWSLAALDARGLDALVIAPPPPPPAPNPNPPPSPSPPVDPSAGKMIDEMERLSVADILRSRLAIDLKAIA